MADTKILDVYIPCQTCGKLIPAGGDNRCLTCRLIDLAIEPKLKWIPVTERLPEQYHAVIVWTRYRELGEATYDGKHFLWDCDEDYADVTHWMPLPEPPKGE